MRAAGRQRDDALADAVEVDPDLRRSPVAASPSFAGVAAVAGAGVSPSRGSGERSSLRSTIAYSECVNVMSSDASENQSFTGPAWSDAIT